MKEYEIVAKFLNGCAGAAHKSLTDSIFQSAAGLFFVYSGAFTGAETT